MGKKSRKNSDNKYVLNNEYVIKNLNFKLYNIYYLK